MIDPDKPTTIREKKGERKMFMVPLIIGLIGLTGTLIALAMIIRKIVQHIGARREEIIEWHTMCFR